jgi:ribosomal protein S24E
LEISILEDRPNPLLKRHEYRFEVAHATAATPSRDSVRGEIAKLVKAPKDRVIIERMHARYGTATTRGDAIVYESVDAAKKVVRAHILVRNGLLEKAAPSPAAPAEPAATPAKPEAAAEPKAAPKAEPKGEPAPAPKAEPKEESKPAAEKKDEPAKPHGKGKGAKAPKAEAAKTEPPATAE